MWLKTDDRYPSHRKIRRLSDGAYRLHHTAQCLAAHDETDGVVTADDVVDMAHGQRLRRKIRELTEAGLWHIAGHDCPKCPQPPADGWYIHDFLDYNDPHEKHEQRRQNERERQRKRRDRRAGLAVEDDDTSRRDTPRDTQRDSQGVSQHPGPYRAVPGRTGPFRVVDGDQDQDVTQVTREQAIGLGGDL